VVEDNFRRCDSERPSQLLSSHRRLSGALREGRRVFPRRATTVEFNRRSRDAENHTTAG